MSVLENRHVEAVGNDFRVSISHGKYLVEFDDRDGLWWAYNWTGIRIGVLGSGDPLSCSSGACSGWDTAEELITVLLAFDGEQVPA